MNSLSIADFEQNPKKNGKWNNNVGESSIPEDRSQRSATTYFVKLAPESPLRKSVELLHDDNSYDSFHNYETGRNPLLEHKSSGEECYLSPVGNRSRKPHSKCIDSSFSPTL